MVAAGAFGGWGASTYTDRTLRTSISGVTDDRVALGQQLEELRRFVAEAHADQISGLAADPSVSLSAPTSSCCPG